MATQPAAAFAQTPTAPTPAAPTTPAAPDSLSPDSLAARLARAEAAIEAMRQQMATESQTTVHTRSRLQLDLTGMIITNAFYTNGRANSFDVPLIALAPSDVAENKAFGATVRQTRLGGVVTVNQVLGGSFIGDLEIDFFGGVSNGPGDRRLFPEPRLRTTTATLHWSRTDLMVGTDVPLVSRLTPISVAAIGIPEFSGSGNLWNWLPTIRLTQRVATTSLPRTTLRWGVQGAVMSPFAGAQYPGDPDLADAGERSARPAFEGRIFAQWGDTTSSGASDVTIGEGGGEIGVGVHHGWVAVGDAPLQNSNALTADWRISFTPRVELRGEWYVGRLVRGLGGGGINQAFGRPIANEPLGPPINDQAGWAQLNAQFLQTLLGGAGCGLDVVDLADRPVRTRNTVCSTYMLWRPSEPFFVGLTFRGIATKYDTGATGHVRQLNLGLGFEL
ncbi:MAG TPA: hypothetical protein VF461_18140 [Gemmatimonadaceae bacterium]